jgi:HEAT repeat protein
MTRLFLIAVIIGGFAYFLQHRPVHQEEPLPAPPAMNMPPPVALSDTDLDKVKLATRDSDPQVRWAAIELLYRLRDPEAVQLMEKALSIDIDPHVRQNAIEILRMDASSGSMSQLLPSLRDTEKDIRIAGLLAIGEKGDPTLVPEVSKLLTDSEPEVRLQALHALSLLQEKRSSEFRPLQEQLRQDYEQIVSRSKRKAAQASYGAPLRRDNFSPQ